jgi:hypothetical protein
MPRATVIRGFSTQFILALFLGATAVSGRASDLDTIGLTQLRALVPSLTGMGVRVAQPEAGDPSWEVNPAAVSQPSTLFTWLSAAGSANGFPNSVGSESIHANNVGGFFYGDTNGVAPGVEHVDNYDANHFYNSVIRNQSAISARIVNQSFGFGGQVSAIDQDYDNYMARYSVVIISGAGNSGAPSSPATTYNGLAVGAYGGASSEGPTLDGRSKPDITAPAGLTSFSAPLVAGAAALLDQAAARGDGGPGTSTGARNPRTIKALLLNGATKPAGWSNGVSRPLDARYGAGVLNVFNSYGQLAAGKQTATASTTSPVGNAHPPPLTANQIAARRGWDLGSVTSTATQDGAKHYFFVLVGETNQSFTLTATLVWQRALNQAAINDLDLFLYDTTDDTLVASSQSADDNVEHLWVRGLPSGRYDLQVFKHGGRTQRVSDNETYALTFEFDPPASPRLSQAALAGGHFQARVFGEPWEKYVIQAASDFADWLPIFTNATSAQGFFDFTDTTPASANKRFYRAASAP